MVKNSFTCPNCEAKLTVKDTTKSGTVKCPRCRTKIELVGASFEDKTEVANASHSTSKTSENRRIECRTCRKHFPRVMASTSAPGICPNCLKQGNLASNNLRDVNATSPGNTDAIYRSSGAKGIAPPATRTAVPPLPKDVEKDLQFGSGNVTSDGAVEDWDEILSHVPTIPHAHAFPSQLGMRTSQESHATEHKLAIAARALDEDRTKEAKDQLDRDVSRVIAFWCVICLVCVALLGGGFSVYWFTNGVSEWADGVAEDIRERKYNTDNQSSSSRSSQTNRTPSKQKLQSYPKIKKYALEGGTAIFTINESPPHHLEFRANSGFVAHCDWKENAFNEFGYDIYEPVVNQTINRLAVMITLRGIIANYLNNKY